MTDTQPDSLHDSLQALIGTRLSAPSQATDPVNLPLIRQWTAAFDDRNPAYEDADAAAQTRFGDIVAPPAMMQTWTMGRPILTNLAERGGLTAELDPDSPLVTLDKAGYIGSLATNSEYEFVRPVRLGDLLTSEAVLETISARKKTALGLGYFITWVTTYTDQLGETVGRQRFTLFKFDPSTMGAQ